MMGKFDVVEHRAWLIVPALTTIIFGIVFSVGISSLLGLPFTDYHLVMPLFLLAIGIDDAFVVVGELNNLTKKGNLETTEETFGKVMKHAGVSVSITSLTSIVSFAVCGITVIPGISSFCVGCSIGLVAIYALTISFFFAALVLKAKHVKETRDGCFIWIKRQKKATEEASGRMSMSSLFKIYSENLLKTPCMIAVIAVTLLCIGVGAWKSSEVDYRFHAPDMLSDGSYLRRYYEKRDQYFPNVGGTSQLIVAPLTANNFMKLHNLLNRMKKEVDIISDVSQWTEAFVTFVRHIQTEDAKESLPQNMTDDEFQGNLSQFLCSPHGVKADGTRCHRVKVALAEVGPAVFNGGVSTFLAISVVVFSENFGWRRLFKCFMMSSFFGLFHGLAMLPVVLSLGSGSEKKERKDEAEAACANKACDAEEEE